MSRTVPTSLGEDCDGDTSTSADGATPEESADRLTIVAAQSDDEATTPDDRQVAAASQLARASDPPTRSRRSWLADAVVYAVIPLLAVLLAGGVAYLKYSGATLQAAERGGDQAVGVAKDTTVAMLSYTPDTADQNLSAAGQRLTGSFRGSYESLVHDVVIPGAKQQNIAATAKVVAAAPVSATAARAVVLVFVNQTVVVGSQPPTDSTSAVRVTLDKAGGNWLVSNFEPI